jgi:hypothetical protein
LSLSFPFYLILYKNSTQKMSASPSSTNSSCYYSATSSVGSSAVCRSSPLPDLLSDDDIPLLEESPIRRGASPLLCQPYESSSSSDSEFESKYSCVISNVLTFFNF